jgi:hypothetical protein
LERFSEKLEEICGSGEEMGNIDLKEEEDDGDEKQLVREGEEREEQ